MERTTNLKIIREKVKGMMPIQPYHNFEHACDVYEAVQRLADMEEVSFEDKYLLKTSALLHDVIMVPKNKDNEERSAEFCGSYLPGLGYSSYEIEKTTGLILATKMPTKPSSLLEMILCDADVDNLGREDCLEKSECVRQELGIPQEQWYPMTLKFLESHKYYTESAKQLRDKGKQENIEKLKKLLQENSWMENERRLCLAR